MDMNEAWHNTIKAILAHGQIVSPRGKLVEELPHYTVAIEIDRSVLAIPERRLNYRFMAAEALWILEGRDELADLTKYNARMATFSDDGERLAGAYGPRIRSQWNYVLNKLVEDRDTRQATLTIWTPNPGSSKDVPCTVAMTFAIRNNQLNLHVYMRSSDVWLGLPYDAFSFSCIALDMITELNMQRIFTRPGTLFITAASSHLYEEHWEAASKLPLGIESSARIPASYWGAGPMILRTYLRNLKDEPKGERFWE